MELEVFTPAHRGICEALREGLKKTIESVIMIIAGGGGGCPLVVIPPS